MNFPQRPDMCRCSFALRWRPWEYIVPISALVFLLVQIVLHLTFLSNSVHIAGAWSTRWKCVQTSGRVGRHPSQSAAYITVFEKKVAVRGSSQEILSNLLLIDTSWYPIIQLNLLSERRPRLSEACLRLISACGLPSTEVSRLKTLQVNDSLSWRILIAHSSSTYDHSFFSHLRGPFVSGCW